MAGLARRLRIAVLPRYAVHPLAVLSFTTTRVLPPPCPPGLAKYNTGVDVADAEPSPVTLAGGGAAPGGLGASAALLSDTTGLVGTSYYIS